MANIQELPEELLEEIFKNLPPKDKRNLTAVCPEFNRIIEKSTPLMSDLTIRIRHEIENENATYIRNDFLEMENALFMDLKTLCTTKRKYQKLEIVSRPAFWSPFRDFFGTVHYFFGIRTVPRMFEAFTNLGSRIRTLKLSKIMMDSKEILESLNLFSNLEEFECQEVIFTGDYTEKPEINLRNLKTFKVNLKAISENPFSDFLAKIDGLEEVELNCLCNDILTDEFVNRLVDQANLKKLRYKGDNLPQRLCKRDPGTIKFKLQELDIMGNSWSYENFPKLFQNQEDLEVLKLKRNFPINTEEMHEILKILVKSEKLKIYEHMCYFRLTFFPGYVMKSVEEYKMFINIPGPYLHQEIEQLVKIIPNVRKLSLSIWTMIPEYFGLGDISQLNTLEKLEELEVSLFIDVLSQLNLPNLRSFTYSNLENRYGNIFLDDRVLPFLEKHKNLREIHFVDGFISKCVWNYINYFMENVDFVSIKCNRQHEMELLLDIVKQSENFQVKYQEFFMEITRKK